MKPVTVEECEALDSCGLCDHDRIAGLWYDCEYLLMLREKYRDSLKERLCPKQGIMSHICTTCKFLKDNHACEAQRRRMSVVIEVNDI